MAYNTNGLYLLQQTGRRSLWCLETVEAVGDAGADQEFGQAVGGRAGTVVDERVGRLDERPPSLDGVGGGCERVAVGIEFPLLLAPGRRHRSQQQDGDDASGHESGVHCSGRVKKGFSGRRATPSRLAVG
jgi:hypothetical protein